MSTVATSYSPSIQGYALDVAATVLSWPSSLVLGKSSPKLIYTTKHIFAMHYVKETPVSKRCYKDITDARWANITHTVTRIVWAVSIVLPVLDAVAWVIRQLAKIDPVIALQYELQDRRKEDIEQERQFEALGDSVRDFAGFLLLISCKKEQDDGMPSEELLRARQEVYRIFCTHFADNQPKDAIIQSAKSILELLQRQFHVDYSKENDVKAAIGRAFIAIETRLKEGGSCDFMMGEKESALYAAWECLVTSHEAFHQLCLQV
jgi:hypothetical protein